MSMASYSNGNLKLRAIPPSWVEVGTEKVTGGVHGGGFPLPAARKDRADAQAKAANPGETPLGRAGLPVAGLAGCEDLFPMMATACALEKDQQVHAKDLPSSTGFTDKTCVNIYGFTDKMRYASHLREINSLTNFKVQTDGERLVVLMSINDLDQYLGGTLQDQVGSVAAEKDTTKLKQMCEVVDVYHSVIKPGMMLYTPPGFLVIEKSLGSWNYGIRASFAMKNVKHDVNLNLQTLLRLKPASPCLSGLVLGG